MLLKFKILIEFIIPNSISKFTFINFMIFIITNAIRFHFRKSWWFLWSGGTIWTLIYAKIFFIRKGHIGGIICQLMYLTVMGIMDSKHRHFGIFWTVIERPDCFVTIICSYCCLIVTMCIYVYMCVVVLYIVCVCTPAGKSGSANCLEVTNK